MGSGCKTTGHVGPRKSTQTIIQCSENNAGVHKICKD